VELDVPYRCCLRDLSNQLLKILRTGKRRTSHFTTRGQRNGGHHKFWTMLLNSLAGEKLLERLDFCNLFCGVLNKNSFCTDPDTAP